MHEQGNARDPQSHDLHGSRKGNQNKGCTGKGPKQGMYFFKKLHSHFLRGLEGAEPLVVGTVGAINNTPVAAMSTFLWPTLMVDPRGTYELNLLSNTFTLLSNSALTVSGASCTAFTNSWASSSDNSDTSMASNTSAASSGVIVLSASALVATAKATDGGMDGEMGTVVVGEIDELVVTGTVVVGSGNVVVVVVVGTTAVVLVVDEEEVVVVDTTAGAGSVVVVVSGG